MNNILSTNNNTKLIEITDSNQIIKILKNNWINIIIKKCYEGPIIITYYDHMTSSWTHVIDKIDQLILFDDTRTDFFQYDELDINHIYYFVLIHHKNKNIIRYDGPEYYKYIYHLMTFDKINMTYIDYTINDNIKKINDDNKNINSLQDLIKSLDIISKNDELNLRVSVEGYILFLSDRPGTIIKLQTDIYKKISSIKPPGKNIHQVYLELYQTDKLVEYVPFFSKYKNDIVSRIHIAMRSMAKEILDIYFMTRQQKNPEMYNKLTDQYKKVLYKLHGIYIDKKIKNISIKENNPQNNIIKNKSKKYKDDVDLSKSINIHDVYHYLKNMKPHHLKQLFYDRTIVMTGSKKCLELTTICTLMFGSKIIT